MTTNKLLRKECEAFLASVVSLEGNSLELADISMVREFPNVLPEELSGLPTDREIEFSIDLIPDTRPIARAPYRIALVELQELKVQLKELFDRGFIGSSVSSWGALVLFVKKKDGTLRLCLDY